MWGKKDNKKTTNNLGSNHQIGRDKYSKIFETLIMLKFLLLKHNFKNCINVSLFY